MLRSFVMLALLLASSGAYGQNSHAMGSRCTPTTAHDNEPTEVTSCSRLPSDQVPDLSFHKKGVVWITPLMKADRLVPLRPVTVEAAPK